MRSNGLKVALLVGVIGAAGSAAYGQPQDVVFPNTPHVTGNTFPFNQVGMTYHQVFDSSLFFDLYGGEPVEIQTLAFSPTSSVSYDAHVVIRFGYTAAGVLGLVPPLEGGGGSPNATGPMDLFYEAVSQQQVTGDPEGFSLVFQGTPFVYDPAQGHLLMEIVVTNRVQGSAVSRANGEWQSSRAYQTHGGGSGASNAALRARFTVAPAGSPGCYADCDSNEILNVDDFICFINEFSQAQTLPPAQQMTHYANCDGSTTEPMLTVDDFICFINEFSQGCP